MNKIVYVTNPALVKMLIAEGFKVYNQSQTTSGKAYSVFFLPVEKIADFSITFKQDTDFVFTNRLFF